MGCDFTRRIHRPPAHSVPRSDSELFPCDSPPRVRDKSMLSCVRVLLLRARFGRKRVVPPGRQSRSCSLPCRKPLPLYRWRHAPGRLFLNGPVYGRPTGGRLPPCSVGRRVPARRIRLLRRVMDFYSRLQSECSKPDALLVFHPRLLNDWTRTRNKFRLLFFF